MGGNLEILGHGFVFLGDCRNGPWFGMSEEKIRGCDWR